MKDNVYRNAIDHLQFSNQLEQAVLNEGKAQRSQLRVARLAAIAAILCLLLGTTVFAAEQIRERTLRVRETGRIRQQFANTEIMEFTHSDTMRGVKVYHMELIPKGYYHFGEGLIYHPAEGFLEVTEDYELKALDHQSLTGAFEKNGRIYELDMEYVERDGGIYSDLLNFYPVSDGEILVNMTAKGSHAWPVYVNIRTGEIRDALPAFTEADFLPEKLESGYEARLAYTQPFREGILISCLVNGIRNGNTDSEALYYWVKDDTGEVIVLDLPKNSIDHVINDTLYYQDSAGDCYVMNDSFQFRKIDGVAETTDDLSCGLLTVCTPDGALEIVDVIGPARYYVPDIRLEGEKLWDTTGYNATRHSTDGRIVVTHSYTDYVEGNRPLDSLAYLDLAAGELRQLHIETDCHVQTHGWLDDNRYCVLYEDGLKRFMSIYEFE